MLLHVLEARYVRGYSVWLRFSDGIAGEVDLEEELAGPVFGPLHTTPSLGTMARTLRQSFWASELRSTPRLDEGMYATAQVRAAGDAPSRTRLNAESRPGFSPC